MAGTGKSRYKKPHSFANIPDTTIQRSVLDRSHGLSTTFDAGYLVPIFVDEALPGDTFTLRAHLFGRLTTPIFPILDNMFMETQFFSVPVRRVWDNWVKMMGEQVDPGDSTSYTVPTCTSPAVSGYGVQSIQDYMGIPAGTPDLVHSNLFLRAASLIWNEWYRDENLQDSIVVDTDDGPDTPTDYVLQRRGKRKDYITSSLPWPAKETNVSLPLGTTAPVIGDSTTDEKPTWVIDGGSTVIGLRGTTSDNNASWTSTPDATNTAVWDDPKLVADLTSATGADINTLRQSIQLQRLYERDARGGSRYTEIIRSHFKVVHPDAQWRSEYLGGGQQQITFAPVPQTVDNATGPQGQLAAYAHSVGGPHGFSHSFTEHCIVIGFVSVRADLRYQYGLNRMWRRSTRWDFYWPGLAHIGEQAVRNQEVYADPADAQDDVTWGYQERYGEYRYKESLVTGKMRSYVAGSMDNWHLASRHVSRPVLNASYIEDDPPVDEVVATPSEPHMLLDGWFDFKAARPMPTYSVPGMMDHF